MDPIAFRERNVIRPGDEMVSTGTGPDDVEIGSYGLDRCLALVDEALRRGDGVPVPGEDWLVGQGAALGVIDTIAPRGHRGEARIRSMSESPFTPVAPALANAVRDATGVRFGTLPLTRDRVWQAMAGG